MDGDLRRSERDVELSAGESLADSLRREKEMLARTEGVLPKVGTRTVRVAALEPAERYAVRPAGGLVEHGVVGPRRLRVDGPKRHLFGARALGSLRDGGLDEFLGGETLDRGLFGGRDGQSERGLLFENEREGGAQVLTRAFASGARCEEATASIVGESDLDPRLG